MKNKLLDYFLAGILIFLSACTKGGITPEEPDLCPVTDYDEVQSEIVFSLGGTKSIVSGISDLCLDGRKIGVTAFQSAEAGASSCETLLSNVPLSFSSSPVPGWSYSPVRHWMEDRSYKFISIYPHDPSCKVDEVNDVVSFNASTAYAKDDVQTNWLAAFNSIERFDSRSSSPTVSISFVQCSSLLSFNLSNCSGRSLTVTDARLYGHCSKALCSVSEKTVGSGDFWSALNSPVSSSSALFRSDLSSLGIADGGKKALYSRDIVVIPQALPSSADSVVFSLTYHFDGGPDITVRKGLHHCDSSWEQGRHYTYNFTIKPLDEIDIIIEDKFWSPSGLDVTGGKGVVVGQKETLEAFVHFPAGVSAPELLPAKLNGSDITLSRGKQTTINSLTYFQYTSSLQRASLKSVDKGEAQDFVVSASAPGFRTRTESAVLPVWGIILEPVTSPDVPVYDEARPSENLVIIRNRTLDWFIYNYESSNKLRGKDSYDYDSLFAFSASDEARISSPLSWWGKRYVAGSGIRATLGFDKNGTEYRLDYNDSYGFLLYYEGYLKFERKWTFVNLNVELSDLTWQYHTFYAVTFARP